MKKAITLHTFLVFTITMLFIPRSQAQISGQDYESQLIPYKLTPLGNNVAFLTDTTDFHNISMVAPNYETPYSQVECFQLGIPHPFSAFGSQDTFYLSIFDDGSGIEVYQDSYITNGTTNEDSLECFTPSDNITSYTGYSHAALTGVDPNPLNNYDTINFAITQNTFSKENGGTQTIVPDDAIWAPGAPHSWTYGNAYYIVNGSDHPNNFVAESAIFSLGNAQNPELEGRLISVYLYKWDEDIDQDQRMDPEERTKVGFSFYQITGNETPYDLIQVPLLNFPGGTPVPVSLESNQMYVLMVEYVPMDDVDLEFVVSTAIDYGPTIFATDLLDYPRFASMLGIGEDGSLESEAYASIGFGYQFVPVVRLNISGQHPTVSTTNALSPDSKLELSPNPANDVLNVAIDLAEIQKEAIIKIYDSNGSILIEKNYKNLKYEKINFDLSKFVIGTYFLHFITADGVRTERFVVHHE